MRGDQLSRVWRLVQPCTIRRGNGRTSVAQLGTQNLASPSALCRGTLLPLEQAGFPIESHTRNGTVRWRFLEGFRAGSSVVFTMPELMALYFSRGLLRPLQGTPLYEAIESAALGKVGAAIPAQGHVLLQGFDRSIAVSNFGWKRLQSVQRNHRLYHQGGSSRIHFARYPRHRPAQIGCDKPG